MHGSITMPPHQRVALRRRVRTALPFLRRFARALTGDQRLADTAVLHVMEDLLIASVELATTDNLKAMLYRRLLVILRDLVRQASTEPGAVGRTPLVRLVELLTKVEGFSPQEAADILAIEPEALDTLQTEVVRLACGLGWADVLIIEDEPMISMQIEAIVLELGHKITGMAATQKQAIAAARVKQPQLILSDVQLADGSSGIDAVREITREHPAPVIFITAYPERLLTGETTEPLFLITKPFDSDAVKATISQALFLSFGDGS